MNAKIVQRSKGTQTLNHIHDIHVHNTEDGRQAIA